MAFEVRSVAGKILHNSFWFGIEQIVEAVVFFGTSITVARYLGPTKLGYFSYINFFVTVVTFTSGMGLASATRKYMSEYLAQDKPGTARAVYNMAYRYQLLGATTIASLGITSILLFGNPQFRTMSVLLILAIIPGIMSWVPANANQAFEDVSKNTFSAFCYILVYTSIILLTVHYHWDLVGIASALLIGRTFEVVLRTIPLHARLRKIPLDAMDEVLVARIRRFCLQAMGIQILMSVVWDRSEMLFLKYFCPLEQIAFYSVSFGLANNLLVIPRAFGSATGISLMVESGRDPTRVEGIVRNACRYLLFVVLPVHLGAAAITREAVGFAYGAKYAGAIPVMIIASILSVPRAFQEISETLIKAADRQRQLLIWMAVTGVVNIAIDLALIPRFGAVGAAWGNGLAQTFGIMVIWQQARRLYTFRFPVLSAVRLLLASAIMAAIAYSISHTLGGLPGVAVAVITAVPIYFVLLKLVRGLHASDRQRLQPLGNRLPGPMRGAYLAAIRFATPNVD